MSEKLQYQLGDLLHLMERLRDPLSGCPWDIKQSYQSIAPSTVEEAYEVVDAIERGDFSHLKEELGDLLFQVIFYCQLGKEDGYFEFCNIIDALTSKLLRRHPHVFPSGRIEDAPVVVQRLRSDTEVKAQWEQIKALEREEKGNSGTLDDIPLALPALTRAEKLQKRAAKVGFDWTAVAPVVDKVKEEIAELEHAYAAGSEQDISEELGDLMFSVVNLARHLKRDPEQTLRQANAKFVRRFQYIEDQLSSMGATLDNADQTLMEKLWTEAKQEPAG